MEKHESMSWPELVKRAIVFPFWIRKQVFRAIEDGEENNGTETESLVKFLGVKGLPPKGLENISDSGDMGLFFVANHPLGIIDGITIVNEIKKSKGPCKILVRDDFNYITAGSGVGPEWFRQTFYTVKESPTLSGKDALRKLEKECKNLLEEGTSILIFPSGSLPVMGKGGDIIEPEWERMFLRIAAEISATIAPVAVGGELPRWFYWIRNKNETWSLPFILHANFWRRKKPRNIPLEFLATISSKEFPKAPSEKKEFIEAIRERVVAAVNKQQAEYGYNRELYLEDPKS